MSIMGMSCILYQPGTFVWPGEDEPDPRIVDLIDYMNGLIRQDVAFDATKEITEMTHLKRTPSQEMRLLYFQAYLLRDNSVKRDFDQAYRVFSHALDLADEYGDLDSQIVLTDQLGLMRYGRMRHPEATEHYEIALALWQERAAQLPNPSAGPEIHFRERLGTTQFCSGDFDAASGSLARVLTIAMHRPDIVKALDLREVVARALWTLGLTHRAQSDMRDGSENLLRSAIECLQKAINLFKQCGAHEYDIGRIHIQVAETLLDLSAFYRQSGQCQQANDARGKARHQIAQAQAIQRQTDDVVGKALARLAQLRLQITRRLGYGALRESTAFDEQLGPIVAISAATSDNILAAKAATLRGEWFLWLGNAQSARTALDLALYGFQQDNMGESTRVQRLLRRCDIETTPPPVRRTRATGPRVSRPRLPSLLDEPHERDAPDAP